MPSHPRASAPTDAPPVPRCLFIVLSTAAFAAVSSGSVSAYADTFGVQAHVMRSRGNLEGRRLVGGAAGGDSPIPDHLTLHDDGDLVGGSLRGELLLRGFRLGMGLCLFSVRALDDVSSSEGAFAAHAREGFGFEHEVSVGYELLRGPFYGYVDLRAVTGVVQVPVDLTTPTQDTDLSARYGALSIGFGPRVGLLVPLGHSLMVDFAAYQHVVGGLEGTTGFVGIGYWENDRRDRFTRRLKSGFTGEF